MSEWDSSRPLKKMRVEDRAPSPGASSDTFDDTDDIYGDVVPATTDGRGPEDAVNGASSASVANVKPHSEQDSAAPPASIETQHGPYQAQEQNTPAKEASHIDTDLSYPSYQPMLTAEDSTLPSTKPISQDHATATSMLAEPVPTTAAHEPESEEICAPNQVVDSANSTSMDVDAEEEERTVHTSETNGETNGHTATEQAPPSVVELATETVTSPPPSAIEDPDFLRAVATNKDDVNAEWQYDSSDAETSSSDDSSSSDDDEDDEESEADDYELLTPEEQARILMREEGGGDDNDAKGATSGSGPRTLHETKEDVVVKPDVVVTDDMEIVVLGTVETIVESFVLVKGTISGETQVLEPGSVLCLADRTVIGAVADLLGRVENPLYSVAFTNAESISKSGISVGTSIFYVKAHSTYVFTQPLKGLKGTDASNLYDEEANGDDMEFSDDEAEAAYKRQKKLEKQAKKGMTPRSEFSTMSGPEMYPPRAPDYPQGPIKYEDDDQDNLYTPLARPPDGSSPALPARPPLATNPFTAQGFDRGRGGRGRGDRGRGDRGRGDRGRGRRGGPTDRGSNRGGRGGQQQQYRDRQEPAYAVGSFSPQAMPGQPSYPAHGTGAMPQMPQYQTQYQNQGNSWNNQYQPQNQPAHSYQNMTFAPGAFVNPNFFRNQQAQGMYNGQQQPQQPQQYQQQQQHQQQQPYQQQQYQQNSNMPQYYPQQQNRRPQ